MSLRKAIELSKEKHKDQKWGPYPYGEHLSRVFLTVIYYSAKENIFNQSDLEKLKEAAWLHDIVEDTTVTLEYIRKEFGDEVADIVDSVTDEDGATRKERKEKTFSKTKENRLGVFLKLCDRLVNVRAARYPEKDNSDAGKYLSIYKSEHEYFKKTLKIEGEYDSLWTTLDDLLK